ncbi:MAG: epoxyqueuosine reductase QueH [Patescibacteria group bacterium]
MPKLLLHVCCGPCGVYPLEKLKQLFDIDVFYFNPNIHPQEEYYKRQTTMKEYCLKYNVNFICPAYNPLEYFSAVKGNERDKIKRCPLCYELRLNETALFASTNQYDYFSSTLLISPHQDIELIRNIGNKLAVEYNIQFYAADNPDSKKKYKGLRPGFAYGRQRSKQEVMYHQHYCGCIFSKNEL